MSLSLPDRVALRTCILMSRECIEAREQNRHLEACNLIHERDRFYVDNHGERWNAIYCAAMRDQLPDRMVDAILACEVPS